jgi:hypothetical protein
MKHLRLALPALAFVAATTWAIQGMACDDSKTSSASAAAAGRSTACSAHMAAQCTPEMAAACRAKGTKTTASVASGMNAKSAAVYASSSASGSCSHAKTSAATAGSNASCEAHKLGAMAAGSSCNGRGMSTSAARSGHGDCDACADMALCYEELEAAGTRTQVVPLKNGVMFVYTAESPGRVSAVQSAMARRNEHLSQIVTAGDKVHLCPECKTMRGAMASGKMSREVVNIEGGALTLMTSSDPAVVAKIHSMVENHKNGRSKI